MRYHYSHRRALARRGITPCHKHMAKEIVRQDTKIEALEAILIDFIDAGAGNSIDLVWHGRAFTNARKILGR